MYELFRWHLAPPKRAHALMLCRLTKLQYCLAGGACVWCREEKCDTTVSTRMGVQLAEQFWSRTSPPFTKKYHSFGISNLTQRVREVSHSHFVQCLHEIVIDLIRDHRVVLVRRVRGDEITDPTSGCA